MNGMFRMRRGLDGFLTPNGGVCTLKDGPSNHFRDQIGKGHKE